MENKITITIPTSNVGSFCEMLNNQKVVSLGFDYMDKYGRNSKDLVEIIDDVLSQIDDNMYFVGIPTNKTTMTKDRAIEVLSRELHHTNEHLRFADKAPEYYEEMGEISDALSIAIDCIRETMS